MNGNYNSKRNTHTEARGSNETTNCSPHYAAPPQYVEGVGTRPSPTLCQEGQDDDDHGNVSPQRLSTVEGGDIRYMACQRHQLSHPAIRGHQRYSLARYTSNRGYGARVVNQYPNSRPRQRRRSLFLWNWLRRSFQTVARV
ncbi:ORF3 [Maize-associated umbra-like virus]|nr:ORF3 [Maize-associated umbra-like virus]